MGTSLVEHLWQQGATPPSAPASVNPAEALWAAGTSTKPVSPNAAKVAHLQRIRPALEAVEAAKDAEEGTAKTALRSFAKGVSGASGAIAGGLSNVASGFGGGGVTAPALQRISARLSRAAGDVAPTEENAAKGPTIAGYPVVAPLAETVGEAAPQFLMGEMAGKLASPVTAAVIKRFPSLAPSVGPALPATATRLTEGAKATAAALPGTAAANTAFQVATDPEHPVTPISLGLSTLGALHAGSGASQRVAREAGLIADATKPPGVPMVTPPPLPEIKAEIERRLAVGQAQSDAIPGGKSTAMIGGEVVPVRTVRRPTAVPEAAKQAVADELTAQMQADEALRARNQPDWQPYSTKSTETTRRPKAATPDGPPEPAPAITPEAPAPAPAEAAGNVIRVAPVEKFLDQQMVTPKPTALPDLAPETPLAKPPAARETAPVAPPSDAEMAAAPEETPRPEHPLEQEYQAALAAQDHTAAHKIVLKAAGITPKDYSIDRGGAHSPAGPDSGAPAYDLEQVYPKDVYGPEGRRFYGTGDDGIDNQAYSLALSLRDRPNASVKIFRAVAKGEPRTINPGDWVTTVRRYAQEHADGNVGSGGGDIVSKTVTAKDIYTSGDSWAEWGYHPQDEVFPRVTEWTGPKGNRILRTLSSRFPSTTSDAPETVSVGRDLNEPARIPSDAPKVARAPKGVEPEGTVTTPEGAVSAGMPESIKAAATRAALKAWAPDSPEVAALTKHLDTILPESPAPTTAPTTAPTGERGANAVPSGDAIAGEAKGVAPERLLNTEKLGLTSDAQRATVQADLERLRGAGVDRERVGLDQQTAAAKDNIQSHLKFMLTNYDPAAAEKLSGAEIGQLYESLSNNAAQRTALELEAARPETTPERATEIQKLVGGLQDAADAMTKNIVKGTSAAGRNLNYLKQIATQTTDPAVWLVQAKRALGDRPLTDETESMIRRLVAEAKEACANG